MTTNALRQFDPAAAAATLLAGLAPAGPDLEFATGQRLGCDDDLAYRIGAGAIEWRLGERAALNAGAGELVGLEHWTSAVGNTLFVRERARVTPYRRQAIIDHAGADPSRAAALFQLLDRRGALIVDLLSGRGGDDPATEMQRRYAAGDVIIKQGDRADFVYTLLSGQAEARQDGVRVGAILESEIFGAMAAFTGNSRSATVVATTDCEVIAVRKKNFIDLVRVRPELCEHLIETMARQIGTLNDTITALYDEGNG